MQGAKKSFERFERFEGLAAFASFRTMARIHGTPTSRSGSTVFSTTATSSSATAWRLDST